ncbi:MAG: hypothetical protein R3300_04180 [Candidatus Promineifilaceae bacterium]|nr:hypothetical protein [Candidatus Promineifilaceae bacterium]
MAATTNPPPVMAASPGSAQSQTERDGGTSTQGESYPAPEASATPGAYPDPGPSRTPAAPATLSLGTAVAQIRLPFVGKAEPTATPSPTHTPTPLPTPTPTIDFAAVRASLQAQGQDLGHVKMGFHVSVGGNRQGLGEWMHRLNAAKVPFFLKSVGDAGPLLEAQQLAQQSGVPHVLVFRQSGDEYDTPDYSLPPEEAARQHWRLHTAVFPPELDRDRVWLETINEVDKERSRWLARFALETARLALAEGYRWAAFGWSSGEPELADWQTPEMLSFLRLAAANPERLAIALHEYSFLVEDIGHEYPFKVGRFQQLFQVTDLHGIPRPTVLVTEWGWTYRETPPPDQAMEDIAWAAEMYAPYPELKGAALWYLGPGFANIADRAQQLIGPVTEFALGTYYAIPLPPERAPIDPERFRPR